MFTYACVPAEEFPHTAGHSLGGLEPQLLAVTLHGVPKRATFTKAAQRRLGCAMVRP